MTAREMLSPPLLLLAACIGVPLVWHWFSFGNAEVSARSAFLVGTGSALIAWARDSWQIGLLVFFLTTLVEFAVAYVIGLVYLSFASAARTDHEQRAQLKPLSERRDLIGGFGGVAIALVILFAWVVPGLQSDVWAMPPWKALLGYCALFAVGVLVLAGVVHDRRRRKENHDDAA